MAQVGDAQNSLGELFVIGFQGTTLSDDTSAFLSQASIGGVLYFKHNFENPEQLAELSNQVQECRRDLPLWISVDQEGGRVQRFKEPFTILPTAKRVGELNSPKLTFELAETMAKELKAVGVNLNFAPVADILTEPKNEVIGDRSFGDNEDVVSKMVTATVRGLITQGVQPCVKHFPGHGGTIEDSHDELPVLNTDLDTLHGREFRPFVRTFKSRCNMVMVAHILNKNLDPDLPATLSVKTIRQTLREEMRYSRIVICDDLEMKAVADQFSPAEAGVLAIRAGCDMIIFRSEGAARKAYDGAQRALEDGKLNAEEIIASAEKIRTLKKEYLSDYQPLIPSQAGQILGCEEHQAVVKKFS